ncbi:3-hydroxybutyryl-CoA dehydrogenase [Granulicella pectinivorans]|uniref:3-hydroxybutyryl-CoA dehydrogenase n=1 Tax=Granulicella pectinivorans TaxID=474950 RepID=A0A1I6MIV3_9BACT|nr:3-hydroxyacyl-CoA dehydrogenase NAD-binding domain-containing protein [Granulicella pectinivorans]SFS15551.1 3-hydroxybutyryl-CoA dehydrogenase [Granulicella pectinivorans]
MQEAAHVLAIIGAGTAGRRFALACAAAGFDVILEDVMPANLRRAQDEYQSLQSRGKLTVALTVEEAVRRADIAIDFVPDELESKLEIFSLMDRMAPPRTIFCTPSEALSITDLASCVYRPDLCFALRGDLAGEGSVRILYPEKHSAEALSAVTSVFAALGRTPKTEPDPDVPMLMKNLVARP